jgi:hypothetical protein
MGVVMVEGNGTTEVHRDPMGIGTDGKNPKRSPDRKGDGVALLIHNKLHLCQKKVPRGKDQ